MLCYTHSSPQIYFGLVFSFHIPLCPSPDFKGKKQKTFWGRNILDQNSSKLFLTFFDLFNSPSLRPTSFLLLSSAFQDPHTHGYSEFANLADTSLGTFRGNANGHQDFYGSKRNVCRQPSIDLQIRELPTLGFHLVSISFSLIACLLLHYTDVLYHCLNAAAVFPLSLSLLE